MSVGDVSIVAKMRLLARWPMGFSFLRRFVMSRAIGSSWGRGSEPRVHGHNTPAVIIPVLQSASSGCLVCVVWEEGRRYLVGTPEGFHLSQSL